MQELPTGFLMALAENPDAMERFARLDRARQEDIAEKARQVRSKEQMRALVSRLGNMQVM